MIVSAATETHTQNARQRAAGDTGIDLVEVGTPPLGVVPERPSEVGIDIVHRLSPGTEAGVNSRPKSRAIRGAGRAEITALRPPETHRVQEMPGKHPDSLWQTRCFVSARGRTPVHSCRC
ncbi:hypothetical protein GCM10022382_16900 [Microbacterium invictum]